MLHLFENPLLRQYIMVITVNLTMLTAGLASVWPSPVLVKFINGTDSVLPRRITVEEGSWIVSCGSISAMLVTLPVFWLLDHIGRKYTLIMLYIPNLIGSFLLLCSDQLWQIVVARSLIGITNGVITIVVPLYASEIASKEIRGALSTILQVMSSIGVVVMRCMGPFLNYSMLNTIYATMALASFMPLLFIPETPNFLYSKGRKVEALNVLTFLRGSSSLASEQIKTYALDDDTPVNKRELFKNRTFLKSLKIGVVMAVLSQVIGFNSIGFYLQTILISTETNVKPQFASVAIGCIQLVASLCTILMTDKFGRKPILSVTLSGMALGMVGLGTFFKLKEISTIDGFLHYVPLISLVVFVFCYSAGVGSVMWGLMAEIFDNSARSVGMNICVTVVMFFGFLTSKYFHILIVNIGPSLIYFIFAVNSILFCLVILFWVPETKGKTFAQIQEDLGAK